MKRASIKLYMICVYVHSVYSIGYSFSYEVMHRKLDNVSFQLRRFWAKPGKTKMKYYHGKTTRWEYDLKYSLFKPTATVGGEEMVLMLLVFAEFGLWPVY